MVAVGEVVTDAAGTFHYVATATRSRTIRFGYRAHLEDTEFSTTKDVGLGVIAKIGLTASPKALRNGKAVVFRGTVAGAPSNCDSGPTSLGYNLASGGDCRFGATGDLQNTDPKLAALQANGGPTDTNALLPGSPAIDAGGDCAASSDQRGIARPQGAACDIGAFELPDRVFENGFEIIAN